MRADARAVRVDHPFLDGNGRIGRLLITLFLVERQRLAQPLLYLSAYIEAHRGDYYDLLQHVRTHGDWTAWLMFFLSGVAETAHAAAAQAGNLLALRETYRRRMSAKPNALALIDALMTNPYVTIKRAAAILEKTSPTASAAVEALVAAGILLPASEPKKGGVLIVEEILHAIQAPT